MKKILTLILIFGLLYLVYVALFTDRKSICETMINLTDNTKNKNQYVTWTDANKNDYVLIRLSDIKDDNGQVHRQLSSQLLDSLSKLIPDYDKHVGQNTKQAVESLKNGNTQLIREPIVAIKATDAIKLTRNNIISVSVRDVISNGNMNTILIPHSSHIEGNNLDGHPIKNRIIKLDKLLFLDYDNVTPSPIMELNRLFLQEIHEENNIKIYALRANGDDSNQIILL